VPSIDEFSDFFAQSSDDKKAAKINGKLFSINHDFFSPFPIVAIQNLMLYEAHNIASQTAAELVNMSNF
jgi:hypothetical protein